MERQPSDTFPTKLIVTYTHTLILIIISTNLDFSEWLKDSIEILGLEGSSIISGVSGVWGGFTKDFSDLLSNIDTKRTPGTKAAEIAVAERNTESHVNDIAQPVQSQMSLF